MASSLTQRDIKKEWRRYGELLFKDRVAMALKMDWDWVLEEEPDGSQLRLWDLYLACCEATCIAPSLNTTAVTGLRLMFPIDFDTERAAAPIRALSQADISSQVADEVLDYLLEELKAGQRPIGWVLSAIMLATPSELSTMEGKAKSGIEPALRWLSKATESRRCTPSPSPSR